MIKLYCYFPAILLLLASGCFKDSVQPVNQSDVNEISIDISELEHRVLDLGDIEPSKGPIVVPIRLENPTSSSITILAAKGDCGCMTLGLLPGMEIPGKGNIKFKISIDQPENLDLLRHAYIWTSKDKNRPISISIKGVVKTGVIWRPKKLYVYLEQEKSDETYSVEFFSRDNKFELLSVETDLEDVHIELGANKSIVQLIVKPQKTRVRRTGRILVKTNRDYLPEVIIPVTIIESDS